MFTQVSQEDVKKIVSKSKTTTCSLDPIPTKLVKQHLDILLPLLTHMVNLSLSSGAFPEEWKTALVVPLLKKHEVDLVPKTIVQFQTCSMCQRLLKG